ncbi:hypothetical protein ACETK8_04395 [Brevundimonas staleyi]|uniref:DUF2927 domain-containing protein n=1 Tax=Brevundimonas staleyi TaxID=74326 RepID=A0ABW0FY22_9CAUL
MPVAAILSSLLLGLNTADAPPPRQQDQAQTALPDVTITGRPTSEAVRDFVGRIAAPVYRRGLAKWEMRVCPGVANLSRDAAQALVDRITAVAADLDIPTGDPGCDPNLVVVFTTDGPGVAQALVAAQPDLFQPNVSGVDRGPAAMRDFQHGDAPVRWWSLSLPVDSDTGQRAVRVPGQRSMESIDSTLARQLGCNPSDCALAYAPMIRIRGASRLRTQIVDVLFKTVIVVDVNRMGQVDTAQLGDYLALVGLAQIDPGADTAGFDTVLNLFDDGGQTGLTEWDRSYLQALYAPRTDLTSPNAQATAVAGIMTRDRRAAARAE